MRPAVHSFPWHPAPIWENVTHPDVKINSNNFHGIVYILTTLQRHEDDGHPATCGITPPRECSGQTSLNEGGIEGTPSQKPVIVCGAALIPSFLFVIVVFAVLAVSNKLLTSRDGLKSRSANGRYTTFERLTMDFDNVIQQTKSGRTDLGDSEEETDKGDAGAEQTVCHDFWLCDVMDPKVKNPVGFFSVNVVIKLCESLPKHKGPYQSYDFAATRVMPFNELKRRRRGATDFYHTNDIKLNQLDGGIEGNDKKFIDVPCPSIVKEYKQFIGSVNLTGMLISLYRIDHNSRKWHRRVIFRAIQVSLTNSLLKYKDDYLQNGIATRDVINLMEFMLSVSASSFKLEKLYIKCKRGWPEAQRAAEKEPGPSRPVWRSRPEHTTRSNQTAHWPEMVTSKKRCRVCKKTTQMRCMKFVYIPPDGGVTHPSLTIAGTSWMSFATRRVITLVIIQIWADLTMASLPESSSVITASGTGFAGCCPPRLAPSRSPADRMGKGTTSKWLPFRVVSFDSREAHVGAASQQLKREQRVAFVDLTFHAYQRPGTEPPIHGLAPGQTSSRYGGLPDHGGLGPHLLVARVESNLKRVLERVEPVNVQQERPVEVWTVTTGQLYRIASRQQLWSAISDCFQTKTMVSYIRLLPDKNNYDQLYQLESATMLMIFVLATKPCRQRVSGL
ncbi:hypothetical protein T07_445 [Trichinella nelsoni]|uniref:PiggyBac transposable element-derived protein domain-containing protein n=1 Tax=Trichinella nelsoni TaxID=6336 RepID=A0A0V0RVF3_9BILA|nr:hypothetical protein T07_445 [Trichinella nelsoni]